MPGRGPPRIVGSKLPLSRPAVSAVPLGTCDGGRDTRARAVFETRPCFSSSWIVQPEAGEAPVVSRYTVAGVTVTIMSPKDSSCGLYMVDPPEYRLGPAQMQILGEAMSDVTSIVPPDIESGSLSTVRPYIKARAKDLLYAKLAAKGGGADGREIDKDADFLAELLSKYTAGYGLLETLLEDPTVQDIYVDSPSSQTPVQVVLRSGAVPGVRQKCRTNIFLGRRDLLGMVSRVKFETGLPFSEAHPVLEADMRHLGARVTVVGPPLSDKGLSVAIRKHSDVMWTMPRLVANGSMSPLLASFLWACVLGRRTVLVAGSRGAGKTSLLGAMLLEFPLSQRIVLIEDTPEIPVRKLQDLGFDLQALRFSNGKDGADISAQDTLRVSLRMGESAIVIGEVRGDEAKVLYESMRAGSAGSSVLGTIHGNSAKGVVDRAVEDLGVSERAFSSTDIVVVIGLIRSPDGARFHRRVTEVAEVRDKGNGVELVSLFEIRPGCTCAKPTEQFSPSCKTIVGAADALGVSPEALLDIIKTRAHADDIASQCPGGTPSPEAKRVASNELLTRTLFGADGPEAGLREWRDWFESS